MSKTYIISDLHLGHNRVSEMRNFRSASEHDAALEAAWFDTVTGADAVWLLGDIAFNLRGLMRIKNWPGRKKLVIGNHDRAGLREEARIVYKSICAYAVVDKDVLLAHIPVHPFSLNPRFRAQIHGHTHAKSLTDERYWNACPEVAGYSPVLLQNVLTQLPRRKA